MKKNRWNLKKLYKNDLAWDKDLNLFKKLPLKLQKFKGSINTSTDFLKLMNIIENIELKDMKLYTYISLKNDIKTNDLKLKQMMDRYSQCSSVISAELAWIEIEIFKVPTWKIRNFLKLKKLNKHLDRAEVILKKKNQITLSKKEQRVYNLSRTLFSSFDNIRHDIENNILKFPKITTNGGKTVKLNHKNLSSYSSHPDRFVRKQVYLNKTKSYLKQSNSFAGLLRGHIQSNIVDSKIYNMSSSIDFLLNGDDLDTESIKSVLKENLKHNKKFNLYFERKRKSLKLKSKELKPYDVLINNFGGKKISYAEAERVLKESILPFGNNYLNIVDKCFNDNWIDADDSKKNNPSNLGYSFNPYVSHPHVFINYKNDIESVMTLGHEVGHAIHDFMLNKNNSFSTYNTSFLLREVVAFTNEMLILYKLMESKNKELKEKSFESLIDMFYININQMAIKTEFELFSYELVEKNKKFSHDLLNKEHKKIESAYNGKFIDYKDSKGVSWTFGNNAFVDFYSAKYLIAFLIAVNFVDRILMDDKEFINNYMIFLKTGNKTSPKDILKTLDIDLNDHKGLIKNAYAKLESLF